MHCMPFLNAVKLFQVPSVKEVFQGCVFGSFLENCTVPPFYPC